MKIEKKHLQCLFCSHRTFTAIKHFLALCRCCTAFPAQPLAQFLSGTTLTKPLPLHILTSTAISLSLCFSLPSPWGSSLPSLKLTAKMFHNIQSWPRFHTNQNYSWYSFPLSIPLLPLPFSFMRRGDSTLNYILCANYLSLCASFAK